jgi:hypothetical protein
MGKEHVAWGVVLGLGVAFIIFILLCTIGPAKAQSVKWYNANQVGVGWNATTTDVEGDPVDPEWGVAYEVLLAPYGERSNWTIVAITNSLAATITLPQRGLYHVGVRATYSDWDSFVDEWGEEYDPAWEVNRYSAINWGDEPLGQEGYELFALRWGIPVPKAQPNIPKGLRR